MLWKALITEDSMSMLKNQSELNSYYHEIYYIHAMAHHFASRNLLIVCSAMNGKQEDINTTWPNSLARNCEENCQTRYWCLKIASEGYAECIILISRDNALLTDKILINRQITGNSAAHCKLSWCRNLANASPNLFGQCKAAVRINERRLLWSHIYMSVLLSSSSFAVPPTAFYQLALALLWQAAR